MPKPTDRPTPESTPIPGGGSWRWDDRINGWVPADAPAEPTAIDADAERDGQE